MTGNESLAPSDNPSGGSAGHSSVSGSNTGHQGVSPRKKIEVFSLLGVVLIAFGLPLIMTSPTYLHIVILIFFYAYLTTSWNMVGGFAGVLPLGHAVFVGIGAYTSTILSLQYGISPWLGMIVGGVIAMGTGVLIGLPTFKMRGAYFALATIAFAEGVRVMVENLNFLGPFNLNGPRGLQIPPVNFGFANFMFQGKEPYYYIILIMLIGVILLTWFISRSKLGYYLNAGGEEPEAAMALGVNVARAKLIAMAMSSFLTALAGTFYAQFSLFIHPKSIISLDLSFEIAFIALIGGRGSIAGPLLGALLLRPVSDFSRIYFGDVFPGLHLVIFGVVLILVMIYQPRGIQEPLTRVYNRLINRLTKEGQAKEAS